MVEWTHSKLRARRDGASCSAFSTPVPNTQTKAPQVPFNELKHVVIFGSDPACGPRDYGSVRTAAELLRTPASRTPSIEPCPRCALLRQAAALCLTRRVLHDARQQLRRGGLVRLGREGALLHPVRVRARVRVRVRVRARASPNRNLRRCAPASRARRARACARRRARRGAARSD